MVQEIHFRTIFFSIQPQMTIIPNHFSRLGRICILNARSHPCRLFLDDVKTHSFASSPSNSNRIEMLETTWKRQGWFSKPATAAPICTYVHTLPAQTTLSNVSIVQINATFQFWSFHLQEQPQLRTLVPCFFMLLHANSVAQLNLVWSIYLCVTDFTFLSFSKMSQFEYRDGSLFRS